jgi:AraC family ethanolamine operon transcriptional activator
MRFAVNGNVSPQEEHAFRDAVLEDLYQALDPQLKQCRSPTFHDRADLVRRFERLVNEEGTEKRAIPELAQALGVARRTLEQVFRDYMGLSPARYVAILRLNVIRRKLLHASDESRCVAELAARYGVVHLGRFAAAYRQMFGERPSQTLRRAS